MRFASRNYRQLSSPASLLPVPLLFPLVFALGRLTVTRRHPLSLKFTFSSQPISCRVPVPRVSLPVQDLFLFLFLLSQRARGSIGHVPDLSGNDAPPRHGLDVLRVPHPPPGRTVGGENRDSRRTFGPGYMTLSLRQAMRCRERVGRLLFVS